MVHDVEALIDGGFFFQRKQHPFSQLARSHGRDCLVEHFNQRDTTFTLGSDRMKIANREFIQPHKLVLVDPGNSSDVECLCARSPRGREALLLRRRWPGSPVDAKPFQREGVELLEKFLLAEIKSVSPSSRTNVA